MTGTVRLLQIDSSARPGRHGIDPRGSHTRSLTSRFVRRWLARRPGDEVIYRDVGASPPSPISGEWVRAAFTAPERRTDEMRRALAESDLLIDELRRADVLVLGAPLYNFSMPASLKAWIDNIVRIGVTFDFDPDGSPDDPYAPLLTDRPRMAVILSSRGGHGLDPGGPYAHMNHLEPSLRTVLGFIGIDDVYQAAVEHQEHGGALLAESVRRAERRVDELVEELVARRSVASAEDGARTPAVTAPLAASAAAR